MRAFLILALFLATPAEAASNYRLHEDGGFSTYVPAYRTSKEVDANHCEFYVNAFGLGSWSHGGFSQSWIEAYLSIGKLNGKVLGAGAYVELRDQDTGRVFDGAFFGNFLDPRYAVVKLTYFANADQARRNLSIQRFAFFVDLREDKGAVTRYWISNQGRDFTVREVTHEFPFFEKSIGSGTVRYVEGPSPIFYQKNACR